MGVKTLNKYLNKYKAADEESKEITKEDTPITPSVTLAEEAELIEKRKNSFYKAGIVGCILFVIISVALMVFYKYNVNWSFGVGSARASITSRIRKDTSL